jgi:glutathione synthase/RimK-type ligase-like ATP-grasp enzyme
MEEKIDIVCAKSPFVTWRVFELECCQKYFGLEWDADPAKITTEFIKDSGASHVLWKLHTESTDERAWKHACSVAASTSHLKHINDPRAWLSCHAKESAFRIWDKNGIPCPKWFEFKSFADYKQKRQFDYPLLIRINNGTSGQFSKLVKNDDEAKRYMPELIKGMYYHYDKIPNTGVARKFIAVQYIPTTRLEKVNLSFRIIVAGDRVVTGYARIGPAADWIAITNRFEPWMEELFVKYQKLCQWFCKTHEAMLVKSVQCLGLNFQGVDVILDQDDKPYFLEVQPGFSVGYAHRKSWHPPFYNPTRPQALVNFLIKNKERLRQEIPLYYNYWLDKYAMFDRAYGALKEKIG